MEHLSRSDLFDKAADIEDFLALNLNIDDPVGLESSPFHFYDQDLSFGFDDTLDTRNLDQSPLLLTKRIHKAQIDKRRYQNISNESRLDLIESVTKKKEKIKHAAERLGINYSSAKYIYQVYKKEGRKDKIIFKKKNRNHEVFDQNQNGEGYNSPVTPVPVSNVFSTQPYNTVRQEGEQSTFHNSKWVTSKPLSIVSVQEQKEEANEEALETDKSFKTEQEKDKLIITPETRKCDKSSYSSHQVNLSTTEIKPSSQIIPSDILCEQSTQTNPLNSVNPIGIPTAHRTQPTPNNMCFSAPTGYLQSYNLNTNYFLNAQALTNNTGLQPNLIRSQIYPVNFPHYQVQPIQVMHPSVSMPLNNNIPFPIYVQIPSMQPQICVGNFNGQTLNMNGYNQMLAVPVMMHRRENSQTATINNAQINIANK